MFSPSSASTVSTARRCPGVSSTTRMSTRSLDAGTSGAVPPPGSSTALIALAYPFPLRLAHQPRPQHGHELLGIHRLGQIVPGPGLDALLAIALHGLGGDGDDRDVHRGRSVGLS